MGEESDRASRKRNRTYGGQYLAAADAFGCPLTRHSSPTFRMTEVPSICRLCPAHCGIVATVADGRVVRVQGDRANPLFAGYSCAKGRALPDLHNHPGRLLASLKRGADGGHAPIASQRAIDEIAARVGALVERHGPRSVAMYVGTNALPYPLSGTMGNAWLRALGSRMFFTSNTIDQPGKQIAAALHGSWIAGAPAFATANTWLLVGQNPLISKSAGVPMQNPSRQLKDAVKSSVYSLSGRLDMPPLQVVAPPPPQQPAVVGGG